MYIFIVNPASRSGHASQIWTEIETLLKERNILYRVYFTSHRGHGTKLAQQLTKDLSSRTTLIVVGGDGTVNEVLNGIEHPEHIILDISQPVPEMILQREWLSHRIHKKHWN
mgnify:CR=1 FL=1